MQQNDEYYIKMLGGSHSCGARVREIGVLEFLDTGFRFVFFFFFLVVVVVVVVVFLLLEYCSVVCTLALCLQCSALNFHYTYDAARTQELGRSGAMNPKKILCM